MAPGINDKTQRSRDPKRVISHLKRYYLLGLIGLAGMAIAAFSLALLAMVAQADFERGVAEATEILQQVASHHNGDPALRATVQALSVANTQYRILHERFRYLLAAIFVLTVLLLAVGLWHVVPAHIGQVIGMVRHLEESQSRWHTIYASIHDALLILDPHGCIHSLNPAAESLFGYRSHQLQGRTLEVLLAEPQRSQFRETLDTLLHDEVVSHVELPMLAQNGSLILVELDSNPLWWDGEREYLWVLHDISEQKERETRRNEALFLELLQDISEKDKFAQEMLRRATTDPLTGAHNRARFDERLAEELEHVNRHKNPLSLMLLDIDKFKPINDTYGHQAGDRVLIELTRLIKGQLRSIDLFARWGGEEFAILAPNTADSGAHCLAEKVRFAVEQHDFAQVGQVTISLGIAQYRSGESAGQLLRRADTALYQAKEQGRNRVISGDRA